MDSAMQTELEVAAFRHYLQHLRERTDEWQARFQSERPAG
jgi:hypothetical protein